MFLDLKCEMTGFIILVNILDVRSKDRTFKLYLIPLNSGEQNFLLSLCKGIEKKAFDKLIDAIKSTGCKRFLRYS